MNFGGKKKQERKAGKVRRSQFVTTFGCGAIVDLPRESVIIAGTDYWKHHNNEHFRINEDGLQQLLGVDYFVNPPAGADKYETGSKYSIPAFRFPDWMYCPKCKRLQPSRKFSFVKHPRCEKCKVNLVPSRFVIACENGHLDEFPYDWWVRNGKKCDKLKELFIEMSEKSSGLDSIIIKCKGCEEKCKRSMAGSFGEESLKGFKCKGNRPWLKDKDPTECDKAPRTMQRGATNLHFGITMSALSIPPWSKRIQQELNNGWDKTLKYLDEAAFKAVMESREWSDIWRRLGCKIEDVLEQARIKRENESSGDTKTWQDIIEGEYRAFLAGNADEKDEFKTRNADVPAIVSDYVDQVVLALRLREVMVLRGFKRIKPDYDIDDNRSFNMLSRDAKNWLPAIELKGEGIFIKLNSSKVQEWENRKEVIDRYNRIKTTKQNPMIKGPGFSPRYVLLHTLAHLLTRQLILQCGYASASIKERIYCTFTGSENALDMAGILLYTATNDSEGSLGGLVREGAPGLLDNTFRLMLESASWCSADPLCIQSQGQGLDALNLAACHSCTLLPETSCEARNCYLDRGSLVGVLDNTNLGFFGPLMERGE